MLQNVVEQLILCPACKKNPFIKKRESNRTRLLVVAGDRGLAGGYNANVFRLIKDYQDAEIIPIGKQAWDRFSGGFPSVESFDYEKAK